jgi:hypothetical protein
MKNSFGVHLESSIIPKLNKDAPAVLHFQSSEKKNQISKNFQFIGTVTLTEVNSSEILQLVSSNSVEKKILLDN